MNSSQVNQIIGLVKEMTPNGDEQLSLLAYALVVGCRSCSVDKETALATFSEAFDEPIELLSEHEMRN